MTKHLKRILVLLLGVVFILIGLAGLVLPIIQGWFFLLLGLLTLSIYSPKLREWIDKKTKPYPHLNAIIERAEGWIVRIIGRP